MKYTAVIVAAGSGTRMGLGYNKVLYQLEPGVRVLDKSIQLFTSDSRCGQIVVVLSATDFDIDLPENVERVLGGSTRAESVYHGVQMAKEEYVFVHDGARPFLKKEALNRLVNCLETKDACFLAISERDTLKEVKDGVVVRTINRDHVFHAQTPQCFKTELLKGCLEKVMENNTVVTDDVQAVELYSDTSVYVVEGDPENVKLTIQNDLK